MKTKMKPFTLIVTGFLTGVLFCIVICTLLLSRYVEMKADGNLVVTRFPEWLKGVTFDNDIVSIKVVDFTRDKDIRFQPDIMVICKDADYGSFWGGTKQGKFLFTYVESDQKGLPEVLNDVHGDLSSEESPVPSFPQE